MSVSGVAQPNRWEPLSGIAFAVCFVASVLASNAPKDGAPTNEWLAAYTGRGHQVQHLATGLLLVLAGLSLMSFLTGLWRRVAATGQPGAFSPVPLIAGGTAAACMGAGGMVMGYLSGGELLGGYPLPGVDLLRLSNDLGFALAGVAGMWAAALSVAVLSAQAYRAGVFGGLMRATGLAVAALLLFSLLFLPIIALLIWVVVAAALLLRRRPSPVPGPRDAVVVG